MVIISEHDPYFVRVWDIESGKPLGKLLRPSALPTVLALSPDGTRVAWHTLADVIEIVDAATGKPICPAISTPVQPTCLAFTPDGQTLAVASAHEVQCWNTSSGEKAGAPLQLPDAPHDLVWHPDGKRLVTVHQKSLYLWDLAGQRSLASASLVPCSQSCFAFNRDGSLIAIGHDNGLTQVCRVSDLRAVAAPVKQPRPVVQVVFDADGNSLATTDAMGIVRHWPWSQPLLGSAEQIEQVVQRATGLRLDDLRTVVSLTRSEWEKLPRDAELPDALDEKSWLQARAIEADQSGRSARPYLTPLEKNWLTHAHLAESWLREGRSAEAATALRTARESAPAADFERWLRSQASRYFTTEANFGFDADMARWYLEQLRGRKPDDGEAQWWSAQLSGDADAEAKALERDIDELALWQRLSELLRGGLGDRSALVLKRISSERVDELSRAQAEAIIALQRKDNAAYKAVCARVPMPQGDDGSDVARLCTWGEICTLAPGGVPDSGPVLAALDKAEKVASARLRQRVLSARGAVLYRSGKSVEARTVLREAVQADPQQATGATFVFLALCEKPEERRQWLERAEKLAETGWPALRTRWLRAEIGNKS